MYSLEVKEKVIQDLKDKKSVEEINREYGISKTTIYKYKKELQIRIKISELIKDGKLDEAKKLLEDINLKISEPVKLSILIRNSTNRKECKRTKKITK